MRAVTYESFGGPEVLRISDVPEPVPGPGQVRIVVRATGVNPMDWRRVAGGNAGAGGPSEPVVPGVDAAGVVDRVGADVEGVSVGDAVFGFAVAGSLAELAVLDAWARVPGHVPLEVAGSLVVVGETAIRTLSLVRLESGQTLLVDGAAGGSGLAAAQVALARGATVIGTASDANHSFLESLGIVPTQYGPGLVERVQRLAPEGVDAALDTAGKGSVADLVTLTGDPSTVVTIADPTAAELGAHVSFTFGDRTAALREISDLLDRGALTMPIAETFRLDQTPEAYRLSQGGHVRGKLVVIPA